MNRKGFTLTELLVVIAIIGVLSLVIVPSVITISNNINERLYNSKVDYITEAAELYMENHPDLFNGDSVVIHVYDLLAEGYLDFDSTNETYCGREYDLNISENDKYIKIAKDDVAYLASGCMTDPRYKSSLNNKPITVTKKTIGVIAEFDKNETVDSLKKTLVNMICTGLENGDFFGKFATGSNDYCSCNKTAVKDGEYTFNTTSGTLLVKREVNTNNNKYKSLEIGKGTSIGSNYSACILVSNNESGEVNNYLKYGDNSANWRVLGLYIVNDKLTPKIITANLVQ